MDFVTVTRDGTSGLFFGGVLLMNGFVRKSLYQIFPRLSKLIGSSLRTKRVSRGTDFQFEIAFSRRHDSVKRKRHRIVAFLPLVCNAIKSQYPFTQ
jgi:hypothetical protein